MTTEKKAPTAEDVGRFFASAKASHEGCECARCKALWDLRDLALLGAQVPGLRNELATAQEQLQTTHRQVAEIAAVLDPEACPDAWGCHEAAQKSMYEVSALQARVAELTRERDEAWKKQADASDRARTNDIRAVNVIAERDALRAQVARYETVMRKAADMIDAGGYPNFAEAADNLRKAITAEVVRAALSTPPAETKKPRSCNLHADCDRDSGPTSMCCTSSDCPDHQ